MHKKMSAGRRSAFLKELGKTGNITVSADRAAVSRGWVLRQRKADAEFCGSSPRSGRKRLSARSGRRGTGRNGPSTELRKGPLARLRTDAAKESGGA